MLRCLSSTVRELAVIYFNTLALYRTNVGGYLWNIEIVLSRRAYVWIWNFGYSAITVMATSNSEQNN